MTEESASDLLIEAFEDQTKVLREIRAALAKPVSTRGLEDAIDDQTEALKEVLATKAELPAINVPPAQINVASPVVNLPPANVVVNGVPRPKRFLSTVRRDTYGMIVEIETVVLE